MNASVPLATATSVRGFALKASVAFAFFGLIWLFTSDAWIHAFIPDVTVAEQFEYLLSSIFILATAVLLGFTLDRNLRRLEESSARLQEAEERWKHALEGASQAVWDWNIESNNVYFSSSWKRMLGFEPHEIGTQLHEWESRVHPDDLPRVTRELQNHIDGHSPAYISEHRVRCKDGSYKWILDSGKIMRRGPDGRPLRMIGTHSDIHSRKQIEAQMRQWADAFRYCAHGIAITVGDSNVVEACNPALAALLRRPAHEIAGSHVLDLYAHEDRDHVHDSIVEADRTGQVRFEAQKVRADGSTFLAQVDVVSVCNAERKRLYRIATVQDVTAARQAEKQQALSAEVLRILNDPQALSDASAQILSAIQHGTGIESVGIRLQRGSSLSVPQHSDLESYPSQALIPIRAHQEVIGLLQLKDRRKDRITPELVHYLEGLTASFGVAWVRLEAKKALQQSEERHRNLVETSYDWIWEVDQSGRYTFASPRIRDLLGYLPEEVLGLSPFDLMPETEAARVRPIFAEIVAEQRAFSGLENLSRHKTGRLVSIETSGVPFFGPSGEFRGYRGMDRDISERQRLEEQVRRAQRLEAIGQLAGGVAHDFNNILAATMMHLGMLQMNPNLDAETRQAVTELESEARRAATLTKQLLMFSRRSVLAMQPVDLNAIVSNLLKMLSRLIGENILLHFEAPAQLPALKADTSLLEQVIVNLVVNARDAMPKEGRLTLRTSLVEVAAQDIEDTRVEGRQPGRFVCLTVADTGHGMAPETLKHIFEPFFTTKEVGKGTGLGLATVHGIVAQHKGWVEVESTVGAGTTFRVFLPALDTPALDTPTERAPAQPRSKPPRRGHESILIVEDNLSVLGTLTRSLKALGYTVHAAPDGRTALKLWHESDSEFDVLLTDMVMPQGVSGLDLTEELQALKPDLKVILSSGYNAEIMEAGLQGRPGVGYLPKPYEITTLAETLEALLNTPPGSAATPGKRQVETSVR